MKTAFSPAHKTNCADAAATRLSWPDLMKGIAIFLVSLGHSAAVGSAVKDWIYTFHMPVFFFVSGYFLSLKEDSLRKTILKKALSLFPLYLVCSLAGVLAESFLSGRIRWDRLLGILICRQGGKYDGYLWFFLSLFGLLCILSAILKLLKKPLPVFLCCCLLPVIVFLWRRAGLPRWFWHLDSAFLLSPYAGLGCLIKSLEPRIEKWFSSKAKIRLLTAVCFLLNIVLCAANSRGAADHIDYNMLVTNGWLTCYGAGVSGVIGLCFLCRLLPRLKWLSFVGKNSMVYYCLNWIGSRSSALSLLPPIPMLILSLLALWIIPMPVVFLLNYKFPRLAGKSRPTERFFSL